MDGVLCFKLLPYKKAICLNPVINDSQLSDVVNIETPSCNGLLVALHEIKAGSDPEAVSIETKIYRDGARPWLVATSDLFSTEPGYHLYRFRFTDPVVGTMYDMYLAYTMQTDNPDTSAYIYMNRSDS